jgi:hypothetical protein
MNVEMKPSTLLIRSNEARISSQSDIVGLLKDSDEV